jgi:hypothetical protein
MNSNKKIQKSKTLVSSYEKIKRALENPNYKFRTINGVSSEAHVSFEAIEKAMREHSDEIVKLFRKGGNGEVLITTRSHYKKKASVKEKVIGAVINSVY